MSGTVWVYFNASRAGLSRAEASALPLGKVYDQIAVWQICECGAKVKPTANDVFDL